MKLFFIMGGEELTLTLHAAVDTDGVLQCGSQQQPEFRSEGQWPGTAGQLLTVQSPQVYGGHLCAGTLVTFLHGRECLDHRDEDIEQAPGFARVVVSQLPLWAQSATKDYIRAEHKLYSVSKLFISQVIMSQVMFSLANLYSAGSQHWHLHPAGWPILFCTPTQEPAFATANTGKNRERFWNKCRWMD